VFIAGSAQRPAVRSATAGPRCTPRPSRWPANPDLPEQPPLLRDVAVDPAEQHALGQVALKEGSWLQVIEDPMQCRTLQQLAARVHRE
jgi:hypothetical protein